MPIYDFVCLECGLPFEKQLSFNEADHVVTCPNGHTTTKKIISNPAVVFKGSGFYVTDHRPKTPYGKE
jgi:putative FmdB family regulatory protein